MHARAKGVLAALCIVLYLHQMARDTIYIFFLAPEYE